MLVISDSGSALARLEDPAARVPVPPEAGEPHGLAWLRHRVCRFADGEAHRARRALVEAELSRLAPDELRAAAQAGDARVVVARVLLERLGAVEIDVEAVLVAAPHYLPLTSTPEADAAVARLLRCWPGDEEVAIAKTCIVLQACEATATLVERARTATIEDVLRDDPPVPRLRRQDFEVDVAAAQAEGGPLLVFGHGPHACPAREHAIALAAGMLEGR